MFRSSLVLASIAVLLAGGPSLVRAADAKSSLLLKDAMAKFAMATTPKRSRC